MPWCQFSRTTHIERSIKNGRRHLAWDVFYLADGLVAFVLYILIMSAGYSFRVWDPERPSSAVPFIVSILHVELVTCGLAFEGSQLVAQIRRPVREMASHMRPPPAVLRLWQRRWLTAKYWLKRLLNIFWEPHNNW